MKRDDKEFNTNLNNKQRRLECATCGHKWRTDTEPTKIKQGMVLIEDVCENCGEYVSKCV
jgi:hypothetical protein